MNIGVIGTFLGITVVIAGLVYIIGSKLLKKPAGAPGLRKVAEVTTVYFRESDVEAKVDCVFIEGRGIVVLIEVDPQIRFRSSYIIEQTLKEQIQRLTGKQLAGVFWRFPMIDKIADSTHAGPAYAASKAKTEDLHYDIGEVSWDEYEQAMKGVRPDGA